MYTKEFILDEVNHIREEIGHDKVNISIEEIYFENDEMWIITEDRPDKSAIIGKGGWVVGKLREKLGLESIHVESYGDFLNKEYKLKLSKKTIHNLDLDFVGLRNLEMTIDYKLANIYSFNFDNFFEEDVDRYIGVLDITEGYTVEIPISEIPGVPVVPVINVTTLRSETLTMTSSSNSKTYSLKRGRNRYPELKVAGASVVTLTFTGSAKLTIDYRAARL